MLPAQEIRFGVYKIIIINLTSKQHYFLFIKYSTLVFLKLVDTNNIKERVSRALLLTGYPLFLDFSILISWFNFSYRIILDGKI